MTTWIKPSGLKIELNDEKDTVAEARRLKWRIEGEPILVDVDEMDKDQLEVYAMETYGENIDKRKSFKTLREEVKGYGDSE